MPASASAASLADLLAAEKLSIVGSAVSASGLVRVHVTWYDSSSLQFIVYYLYYL